MSPAFINVETSVKLPSTTMSLPGSCFILLSAVAASSLTSFAVPQLPHATCFRDRENTNLGRLFILSVMTGSSSVLVGHRLENSSEACRPSRIESTLLSKARVYFPSSVPFRNPLYANQSSSPFGPAAKPSRDMELETITLRIVLAPPTEQISPFID